MIEIAPPRLVAFVDDDEVLRAANAQTLALADLDADLFADAAGALAAITADYPGVVVTDVRMPGMDGLQLHRRLREIDPELPVILITGHGDVPMAVAALKDGAWDFLTKPFSGERLVASIRRGLAARRLTLENRALRAAAIAAEAGGPLIGASPAMVALREAMATIAASQADVLIEGETGTGKELVAVLLHRWSSRRARPFVAVDCGAVAESDLVGFRDGAVPGAKLSRAGQVEQANGGTLYLDEPGALADPLQIAMLRVIEDREVRPLGSAAAMAVDLRVIASIRAPSGPERQRLRDDLYYRLYVARLRVPPLRERREDVPLLFAHFLDEACRRERLAPPLVSDDVRAHLFRHDWPGNVRELRHFAHRLAIGATERAPVPVPAAAALPLPDRVQRFEAGEIRTALAESGGDVRAAIALLGLPRKTFYDKLAKYGIRADVFRRRQA